MYCKVSGVLIALGCMAALLFSCQGSAHAGEAGKAVALSGRDVSLSVDGGRSWVPLVTGQSLPAGACVRTGKDSSAALLLNDRSQIRLRANSVFCIKESGSSPGVRPVKKGFYSILKGKVWFRNKRRGPKPLFETPVVTASIRGTEMVLMVDDKANIAEVTVLEGQVRCANQKGEAVIVRGEAVKATAESGPRVVKVVSPEHEAQWLLLTPEIVGMDERKALGPEELAAVSAAQDGMELLSRGRTEDAMRIVERAMEISPRTAAVNVAMATVLQSLGRFEEALEYARAAHDLAPGSVPALLRLVELFMGLDRVDEARQVLSGFKGGADARIHLMKGYVALAHDDVLRGEQEFRKAISMDPSLAPAHLGLGIALYRKGAFKAGLEEMEKASLLEPLAAFPHNYLAKALYEQGEREEAEVELRRAAQLDPNDPTPHLYLAVLLADRYMAVDGVRALMKSIELNDNRLATRSRFLLDQDRAVRNVSLAYSLAELGLHEWARATGDMAVWDDPTSSGAYLFRASQSVGLRAVDAQTLGDLQRARLLQPVNSNTYVTYTQYQSLMEMPETRGSVWLKGGSDDTLDAGTFVRGGGKGIAFYGDVFYSTTDGPREGTGRAVTQGLLRIKTALSRRHQLMLQALAGHRHEEDLGPWMAGSMRPEDMDSGSDYWNFTLAYHFRQQAGRSLLMSFASRGMDSAARWRYPWQYQYVSSIDTNLYTNSWRWEAVELYRVGSHRITAGGAFEVSYIRPETTMELLPGWGVESQTFLRKVYEKDGRIFARDLVRQGRLTFVLGLTYCWLHDIWEDGRGDFMTREEVLPEAGVVFSLGRNHRLRVAYFQEIQPEYLSGSLQPMEVAGFKKVRGLMPGTWTWNYAAAWDGQWNDSVFTRLEIQRIERRFPTVAYTPWRDERLHQVRLVTDALLTSRLALECTLQGLDFHAVRRHRDRTDISLGLRLTYVHPWGIKAQTALWLVNQNAYGKDYGQEDGDEFAIMSVSLEKSIKDKSGTVYLNLENLFDQEYDYIVLEQVEATQLPWQGFRLIAGIRWNF